VSDIVLDTAHGPIEARLELPADTGPWPGVVLVHDMATYGSDIKAIARRVADHGYLALAPNLYSRGGALRCVTRVMADLYAHRGRAVDDLRAARAALAGRADCTGAVGIAGFCMGGGFALVMSTQGFDASAPFYPSLLQPYGDLMKGSCPVVASYGARDPVNPRRGPALRAVLERENIPHDVKVYDGVGHSFANRYPGAPLLRVVGFGYDDDSTNDAWRRVFAFFDTHLRPPD
jgi:carboxymethylenebutenolidase